MKHIPIIVTFALSLALGLGAGWLLIPAPYGQQKDAQRTVTAKPPSQSRPDEASSDTFGLVLDESASEFERLLAVALHSTGRTPPSGTFVERLKQLTQLEDWTIRNQMRNELLREWSERAPLEAFDYVKSDSLLLSEFVPKWTARDRESALAALKDLPEGHMAKREGIRQALRVISEDDPSASVTAMKDLGFHDPPTFAALARIDVAAALAAVDELSKTRDEKKNALWGIAREWAKLDVAEAVKFVNNLKEDRDALMTQVASAFAETDPHGAIDIVNEHVTGKARTDAMWRVVFGWSQQEPEAALDFAESIDDAAQREQFLGDLSRTLADDGHSELAVRALVASGSSGERTKRVFLNWASDNWDEAASRALQLADPTMRTSAVQGLLNATPPADSSSGESIDDWVTNLIDVAADDGATDVNLNFWLFQRLQPATLHSLVAEHETVLQKSLPRGLAYLAGPFGEGDPAGAIEIMNAMSKGLAKDEAAVSIAGEWAQSDPEAAAQWVETLPPGKAHEFAYRNVANAWSRANPADARVWIDGMETSPARDFAIGEFINVHAGNDPETSLRLTQSIADPATRDAALTTTLKNWINADLDNALKAIAKLDLPEKVATEVAAEAQDEAFLRILTK